MKKFTRTIFTIIVLVSAWAPSYAQWTVTNLSEPRFALAAASNGNRAIFAGGIGMISWPPAVADVFDETGTFLSTRTTSRGRVFSAGTAVGSKILFGGGAEDWILSVFTHVDMYDGSTGGWSRLDLSMPRSKLAATSWGSLAFFGGGLDEYGAQKAYKLVDVYDTTNQSWSQTNLSVERHSLAAASAADKVVFAGGVDYSGTMVNTVDIYDYNTGIWTTDTLSEARGYLTASAVGDKIYFAGGISATGPSKVVDIYDALTGTWTHDSLSQARGFLSSAPVNDLIFFAGGSDASFTAVSTVVDIYNTTTQTWSTSTLTHGRTIGAATSINGLFMVGGGLGDAQMPIGTVEIYSLITSIKDVSGKESSLNIFPNPVANDLNIRFINTISDGSIEITDDLGQKLFYRELNNNTVDINLNLDSFGQGIYFVRINDGKDTIVRKFVKQ